MILDTLDMIEKGYEAEHIRELLEKAGDRMMIYIALQTLEFLKKGGRVTPAAAALGSVFNIKPILKLQTGKLVPLRSATECRRPKRQPSRRCRQRSARISRMP